MTKQYLENKPDFGYLDEAQEAAAQQKSEPQEGDEVEVIRGLWVLCVNSDLDTALADKKCIEKALLSGEPFALEFAGTRVGTKTSKVEHPMHMDKYPLGVDWSDACAFMSREEVITFYKKLESQIEEATKSETNLSFSAPFGLSPLARMVLQGRWQEIVFLINTYDPRTSSAVIVGSASATNAQCFHARSVIARFAKPLSFEDSGEWQHGHVTALIAEHMMNTMFHCEKINTDRKKAYVYLKASVDKSVEIQKPQTVTIQVIDNLIGAEFNRIVNDNNQLARDTPISMRRVVLDAAKDHIVVTCFVCGKSGAKSRCSRCHLYRYCGAECQKKHWIGAELSILEKYKAHKQICPMARSFVLALTQVHPSRVTPELFTLCTKKAVEAVTTYCEGLTRNMSKEQQYHEAQKEKQQKEGGKKAEAEKE